MIIYTLDLGSTQPFKRIESGVTPGTTAILGGVTIVYPHSTKKRSYHAKIWCQSLAQGGFAAGTRGANEFLAKQLEELGDNALQQPTFVQWFAGGSISAVVQPQDGWYVVENLTTDYTSTLYQVIIVEADFTFVSPQGSRRIGMSWAGGARVSDYTGAATNWITFPIGSTGIAGSSFTRTGGEGAITVQTPVPVNPAQFVPSATLSQYFSGGIRYFDTQTVGGNAVPTDGTFLNTNWVEVFGTFDHAYLGDSIVTNGLILTRYQAGQTAQPTIYLWNTALNTPAWQQIASLGAQDSAAVANSIFQSFTFVTAGREFADQYLYDTANNEVITRILRHRRGTYFFNLEQENQSANNTNFGSLLLAGLPTANYFTYTENNIADNTVAADQNQALPTTGTYGYAAIMPKALAADRFVTGFLYQNKPGTGQPRTAASTYVYAGDSSGNQGVFRFYGIFVIPLKQAELYQAEAESGTLGTGWSSVADSGASGGNAAKAASGTASGNSDLFGTAFLWGTDYMEFDVWFRVRVSANASSTAQMQLGMWDNDAAAFSISQTYASNAFPTAYTAGVQPTGSWAKIGTWNPNSFTHHWQFKALTTATLTNDWFIDEAVIVPKFGSGNAAPNGPQDLFQQYSFDRTTRFPTLM